MANGLNKSCFKLEESFRVGFICSKSLQNLFFHTNVIVLNITTFGFNKFLQTTTSKNFYLFQKKNL